MHSNRTILAVLLLILAAVCATTSYAQSVTFYYHISCNIYKDPYCPMSKLSVAHRVGSPATDLITIAAVKSDVPGHTDPVPISDGSLNWTSTPATWVWCVDGCEAEYSDPGGAASIVGSVFGLPEGSTLLTASFLGGANSFGISMGYPRAQFTGSVIISHVDPAILANLGILDAPNYGIGVVSDSFVYDSDSRSFGASVIFTPSMPGTFNLLHNFTGGLDGRTPSAGLTMDKAGNLYGTDSYGGSGHGTVFKLAHKGSSWVFNPLYAFAGGTDGASPEARVTVGPDGSLYGVTSAGGSGYGTVFNLRPAPTACTTGTCPWTETVLYRFAGGTDGIRPHGDLVFDRAGNLYGTTINGGTGGYGTVYKLTPSNGSWTESVLYSFTEGGDGQLPESGLIFDQSGNLYGTTYYGGQNGNGTVFQLKPAGAGWVENILYRFQGGSDGRSPTAGLILDQAGNLYGMTSRGGSNDIGTVFELSPSVGGWMFSVAYNLVGMVVDYPPGNGSLSMDASGNLYGANGTGGDFGGGSVFRLVPSNGSWTPTILYQFTGGGDGAYPIAVVLNANGDLFGTTNAGGAYGSSGGGVVFEITP